MQKVLLLMVSGILILSGCSFDNSDSKNQETVTQEPGHEKQSGNETPNASSSESWAYSFVGWEDKSYVITDKEVPEERIGAEIGEVTSYSDNENADKSGNFSNTFEEGTKYYEITDKNTEEAIAVEVQEGTFIKAVYADIWLEYN